MKLLNPLKLKYASLYWAMADAAQAQSVAQREQCGCVIVTPQGIVLPGWNGQPAGHPTNVCENTTVTDGTYTTDDGTFAKTRRKTDRSVIHAENNALGKAMQAGISLIGAHLYTTVSCCDVCARGIVPSGISHVFYDRPHDDLLGIQILQEAGVLVLPKAIQFEHLEASGYLPDHLYSN